MSNVKLAIRVRPFTEREQKSEKERIPVVSVVDDNTVAITNVKVSVSGAGDSRERVRRYYADHTFDSAQGTTHPNYASQEMVFNAIGREVLESVSRGGATCVLAYGQSATGKTHTMMGSEEEPGLVPRLCRELAEARPFELTVSFFEIYNERVHDLLAGESPPVPAAFHSLPRRRGNTRKDLRVREHPDRGPYVQNLRRVAIIDVEALLSLVSEGARRRRTAATRRNASSSRSHALLELATPTATLHLADLAGSEKAGWEGCGGRQKEGANINKSLVALSNVISALVCGRGRFVPYRDSALTWLLKDCFTGGARTFIIATVSPSVACYGESASTLRWAERARQLPKPRPSLANIASSRLALQAQYNNLIAELSRNYIRYVTETGKLLYDDNHWKLNENNVENQPSTDEPDKTANIGNIMSLLHPKTEAQSESTASSVASGSSDVINNMDKNKKIDLKTEISKEVDKLFGPTLERTRSNSDLKVIAPLRHKRRQYKSQEILPIAGKMQKDPFPSGTIVLSGHSKVQINDIANTDKSKPPQIPILYDNQRAEIVASVTERLYNKFKKKEEAASQAAAKVESVIDKKIVEPLNELKICTNARQRLMEISHKALRNKRRIGIPAYTQTRKMVTRVRDQGIDVQTDLEMYVYRNKHLYTLHRDAATETIPMTPRCKEIAVGSKYGMLNFNDNSTITEEKKVIHKSSFVMTDIVSKCDSTTQTQIVPPPRRKRRGTLCKCMQNSERNVRTDEIAAPIISINISQVYPADSESQTSADESDYAVDNVSKSESINMTPDLLTNHSTIEPNANRNSKIELMCDANDKVIEGPRDDEPAIEREIIDIPDTNKNAEEVIILSELQRKLDDFPDTEECALPRVTVAHASKVESDDMKDIILGRKEDVYPYNIVFSPPRVVDYTKRIVKFKEDNIVPAATVSSQTIWDWKDKNGSSSEPNDSSESVRDANKNLEVNALESHTSAYSDSSESSKADSDSFIWKKPNSPSQYNNNNATYRFGRSYTPVYRGSKYAKAKAKLYREFLGLDKEVDFNDSSRASSNSSKDTSSDSAASREISNCSFRRRKNVLEEKLKFRGNSKNSFRSLEHELINSCNSLEASVNKCESYLSHFHGSVKSDRNDSPGRTPTKYLQHLVELRRQVVKGDCDNDSSFGNKYAEISCVRISSK